LQELLSSVVTIGLTRTRLSVLTALILRRAMRGIRISDMINIPTLALSRFQNLLDRIVPTDSSWACPLSSQPFAEHRFQALT
jgi:hypothetical protein